MDADVSIARYRWRYAKLVRLWYRCLMPTTGPSMFATIVKAQALLQILVSQYWRLLKWLGRHSSAMHPLLQIVQFPSPTVRQIGEEKILLMAYLPVHKKERWSIDDATQINVWTVAFQWPKAMKGGGRQHWMECGCHGNISAWNSATAGPADDAQCIPPKATACWLMSLDDVRGLPW